MCGIKCFLKLAPCAVVHFGLTRCRLSGISATTGFAGRANIHASISPPVNNSYQLMSKEISRQVHSGEENAKVVSERNEVEGKGSRE